MLSSIPTGGQAWDGHHRPPHRHSDSPLPRPTRSHARTVYRSGALSPRHHYPRALVRRHVQYPLLRPRGPIPLSVPSTPSTYVPTSTPARLVSRRPPFSISLFPHSSSPTPTCTQMRSPARRVFDDRYVSSTSVRSADCLSAPSGASGRARRGAHPGACGDVLGLPPVDKLWTTPAC
jgi:hypothetical protein